MVVPPDEKPLKYVQMTRSIAVKACVGNWIGSGRRHAGWARFHGPSATLAPARPAGGASWEVAAQGNYVTLERLRTKGVTTRLIATDYTQEMLDNSKIDFAAYRSLWPKLGLENFGWDMADAAPGGRILHADMEKVHALQGASRYTTSGEYINDSVELDVITYKKGRWGIAGLFGYMTPHDRANDVRES